MVGRPKKQSGFRGMLNNSSKKHFWDKPRRIDFSIESSDTNSSLPEPVIPFQPIDRDWQQTKCKIFGVDHVNDIQFGPSSHEAGILQASE